MRLLSLIIIITGSVHVFAELPHYQVVDLGMGEALGISQTGNIVGADRQYWTFMNGTKHYLGYPATGGGQADINDAGQVAASPAFYFDGTTSYTWTPLVPSAFWHINELGVAVGRDSENYMFLNGQRTNLQGLDGYVARDINSHGVLAADNLGGSPVRIYDTATGSWHTLALSTSYPAVLLWSVRFASNDNLLLLYKCVDESSMVGEQGFLVYDGQVMRHLPADRTDYYGVDATGFNSHDITVGTDGMHHIGWMLIQGEMHPLSQLLEASNGWSIVSANDINDAGQIVGVGRNASGELHAVLLNPIPEPTTAALLFGGVLMLIKNRRRRHRSV